MLEHSMYAVPGRPHPQRKPPSLISTIGRCFPEKFDPDEAGNIRDGRRTVSIPRVCVLWLLSRHKIIEGSQAGCLRRFSLASFFFSCVDTALRCDPMQGIDRFSENPC